MAIQDMQGSVAENESQIAAGIGGKPRSPTAMEEAQAKLATVDALMGQLGMEEQRRHLRYEVANLSKATTMSFVAWPAAGGVLGAAASYFAAAKANLKPWMKAAAAALGGAISAIVSGKLAPKAGKMEQLAGQMNALSDKYAQRVEEHVGHMAEQMAAQQSAMPEMPQQSRPEQTAATGAPSAQDNAAGMSKETAPSADTAMNQHPAVIEDKAINDIAHAKDATPDTPNAHNSAEPHHHVPGDMAGKGSMASKFAPQGSTSYMDRTGGQRAETSHEERAIERQQQADRVGSAPVR
ncbi:MAG TPA: hypothetical protein VFT64_06610 [Rickettsiales bacterium]|nr:hypothetical protein [Rickettsiales bacterium]